MEYGTSNVRPFVSVIVPVYNDEARIATCVEALLKQDYPRDRYEVLMVDNGSSDGTRDVIGRYPVTLLVEDQIRGSYAARNKGLEHAKGDIIAFTDSDCTPVPGWISEGVAALESQQVDLAGGNVRFYYHGSTPTGAEIYDSISNMQMEQSITTRKVAKTANLFVNRRVFDEVGPFPHELKSGGDILWTKKATSAGFELVYAPKAEVGHPTRRLRELVRKQFRVGKGHRAVRAKQRQDVADGLEVVSATARGDKAVKKRKGVAGIAHKARGKVRGFMPLPMRGLHTSIRKRNIPVSFPLLVRVWGASWAARAATEAGTLSVLRVK